MSILEQKSNVVNSESYLVSDQSNTDFSTDQLLDWYMKTFVASPDHGYALMNPPGHEAKYIRRNEPITAAMIKGALYGETRRTKAKKEWLTAQYSYAVVPQTASKAAQARVIALDIDHGGKEALAAVLGTCREFGVWAFAQVSESTQHKGGHIWIICDQWQPAPMLANIGARLALAAGVEAEVYPKNVEIRLPLMPHLRAPRGTKRYPLIFQSGEIVDGSKPWPALAALHDQAQTTTTEQLTIMLEKLPPLPVGGGDRPRHASKVVGSSKLSVIGWFNANFSIQHMIENAGATIDSDRDRVICCPYHDDQTPSLGIFRHSENDKQVCGCFSQSSGCPVQITPEKPYFDAFDLYKLREKLSTSDAVKKLVTDHELGQKREFTAVENPQAQPIDPTIDPMIEHEKLITQARGQLVDQLLAASDRSGEVTIIRATPGLGKTHAAGELANKLQAQGKTVAICAPTLAVAENEWLPRLKNGHVWRSKLDICTCEEKGYLQACIKFGFSYPRCKDPACPYATQKQKAHGKVIIYQHAHLALTEFAQVDAIIVDESPMAALLPEHTLTNGVIAGFLRRHPNDASAPLLQAMLAVARDLPESMTDVHGPDLVAAIEAQLDGWTIDDALSRAMRSKFNVDQPAPPQTLEAMAPQFLANLLTMLDTNRSALSFGRSAVAGKHAFVWHSRRIAALDAYNSLIKPSIIVLDGSAIESMARDLYSPWPTNFVDIDCPVSPMVQISQISCTSSTRHVVKDQARLESLARNVAMVANRLELVIDGGITYQAATSTMQRMLGGQWLHYGGQRGSNDLADASCIAVVCSPTTPPAALERKARALWPDVLCTWQKQGGRGEYIADDPRLQSMNQTHALEELRQSVYRARPLTAQKPTNLLIFTPWDLQSINIEPNRTISEIPYHKSLEATNAAQIYQDRAGLALDPTTGVKLQPFDQFQCGINTAAKITPPIENPQKVAVLHLSEHRSTAENQHPSPPLPAQEENPADQGAAEPTAPARSATYAPLRGDVLTQYGKKIFITDVQPDRVLFDVVDLGKPEGAHWLPLPAFVAQVQASQPKLERLAQ